MASTYIQRTPSSNGNQKKWTWSGWIKLDGKSGDATYQYLFNCVIGSGYRYTYITVRHGTIETYGGVYSTSSSSNSFDVTTNRLLRDSLAWYHVVVVFDSAQSTSTDRVKIYINGVQETSLQGYVGGGSLTYPAQNADSFMNVTTTPNKIGESFNGSMSHVHFCDGYAYQPSDFGSTDSTTGEWKINTTPSVSYGTNGFWLFKDDAALTDRSGNSNNFTSGGGTLTKTEDCPSNVFCTLNPLYNQTGGQGVVLMNGNTRSYYNPDSSRSSFGTIAVGTGKYYFEAKLEAAGTAPVVGVVDLAWSDINGASGYGYHDNALNFGYNSSGQKTSGGTNTAYGDSYTAGDIIGVAIDKTNNKLYFAKNGVWQNSSDPTSGSTGTGSAYNLASDTLYTSACRMRNGGDWKFNFGNGFFGTTAISSEGTNASGIGKFEYDVPTGYTALSTKGLNE